MKKCNGNGFMLRPVKTGNFPVGRKKCEFGRLIFDFLPRNAVFQEKNEKKTEILLHISQFFAKIYVTSENSSF